MKIYPALVSSLLFPRFENILKNIHRYESKTKISAIEYIEDIDDNSDVSILKRTSEDTKEFIKDYSGFLKSNYGVSKTMEEISSIKNNHISPPDMTLTILYIIMPSIRFYIHIIMLYMFLISKPSAETLSYSYSPFFNFDTLGNFNLSSVWVKIDKGFECRNNYARDMNIDMFYKAHELLSNEQKKRYRIFGKKIVFGDDIVISFPIVWFFMPILIREKEDCVIINSPVLKSYNSNQYTAKLISKENFIEYLTLKAF